MEDSSESEGDVETWRDVEAHIESPVTTDGELDADLGHILAMVLYYSVVTYSPLCTFLRLLPRLKRAACCRHVMH
jgi:hypothetical protein